jgi:hypothetical protein
MRKYTKFMKCLLLSSIAVGLVAIAISAGVFERSDSGRVEAARFQGAGESRTKYRTVILKGIPHIQQKPDFCGEACAAMFLQKLGYRADQDFVFDKSGLDPLSGRGCYTKELYTALKQIGFQTGPTWYRMKVGSTGELEKQFATMHADLRAGIPSIICMHYDAQPKTTEHFRLIVGYDGVKDEVIYHEPAVKNGGHKRMSRARLLSLWPLKYGRDLWTVIRMPLKPGRLKVASTGSTKTNADYAQHIMKLKRKLPHQQFHIVIRKPFVVIGDERPAVVQNRSLKTVKWAVDQLKSVYFKNDPDEILDIWLFKDKSSYETNAVKLFKSKPTTPFGYYSSYHRALVMNIATGGGTLVHEIVHPFMASNFRRCPSWFNEGLASLYEACGEENGRIHGYTNWRLAGLKQAIRAGKVPSFKTLCATTTQQFYRADPGTNYSQARYLCYYLQQKGLLVKYFNAFRKNAGSDAGGYKTLQSILGVNDMAKFQQGWERYVLALK